MFVCHNMSSPTALSSRLLQKHGTVKPPHNTMCFSHSSSQKTDLRIHLRNPSWKPPKRRRNAAKMTPFLHRQPKGTPEVDFNWLAPTALFSFLQAPSNCRLVSTNSDDEPNSNCSLRCLKGERVSACWASCSRSAFSCEEADCFNVSVGLNSHSRGLEYIHLKYNQQIKARSNLSRIGST